MMITENDTGRATSATAAATIRRLSSPAELSARWRRTFSTTTIDASTTIPTEKARPPRLMRFEDSPARPMTMKVTRKVRGSDMTTMRAVLISAMKRKRTRMTNIAPWRSACITVAMHAAMREVRS